MGIENRGNFRKVEEAEELAEGSGVEQEVTSEQVNGNSLEVAEESNPKLVAQEQQVEQEAIPEPSPQLLQIGPDFDENWASYDTQDRAILRLDKGDIEELKTELQAALESGQITLSNEGFKRLDIPEEQKEIKKKLQTIESTIQALIQSNDNLPRDLRETLQQKMRNDNAGKSLVAGIQGRIEFIGERRRFKFFGIGQEEIEALESLRESIKAEFIKYSQLQNSEQDIVDRDVIIKFQQLPESIQQSIYSLENPTSENINEVIEAILSYKTPQELIEKRQEIKEFTRSYSSVERINKARELREIPKNERKNELDNFYKEQEAIRLEFLETLDERQVEDIMNQDNVIFTHGIPLESMKNTSHNNIVIDTEKIKPETKAKLILGFQPTISACVTKISEQNPNAHYYKFGLMIGRGTVMLAHNRDTGTIADNMYSRRLKDGEYNQDGERNSYINGKSYSFLPEDMSNHSIQMNIQENIRQAIEEPIGVGSARNEVIIENPDAIGIYIDFNNQISEAELIQITKIARDVNLPIFGLRNGQIFYLQGTGKTEVNLSELHVSKNLTKRQRLEYIDDAIQENIFQNGQIAIEVKKRISLLKSQIKETPEMEQEISTQQESEDFYPDFKYLDSYHRIFYNADLILKGEHSRVKAIPEGGDDIINFFSDMGVSQEHMRKIRSIFENKSLPECRELIDNFLHQFNEAKEMLSKWKQSQIETQQIT